jgi:hypothetical protein
VSGLRLELDADLAHRKQRTDDYIRFLEGSEPELVEKW